MAKEQYKPHPHTARNPNHIRKQEQIGINQRIAILITNALGSVPCMYLFIILALIGFPGLHATPPQYVQWLSQTCIQLVALSVLGIAQNLLNRHTEIQSDAMYETDMKTFHDAEQVIRQNNELLQQTELLINLLTLIHGDSLKQTEMLTTLLTPPAATRRRTTKREVQA